MEQLGVAVALLSRAMSFWSCPRSLPKARSRRPWLAVGLGLAAFAVFAPGDAAAGPANPAGKAKPGAPNTFTRSDKLDRELARRASSAPAGTSRVIVQLEVGASLPPDFAKYARKNGHLNIINAHVLDIPTSQVIQLASQPVVVRVCADRPAVEFNYRTALTVGSRAVQSTLGLTGSGIGIAVIDSGITSWHDDLTDRSARKYPY